MKSSPHGIIIQKIFLDFPGGTIMLLFYLEKILVSTYYVPALKNN